MTPRVAAGKVWTAHVDAALGRNVTAASHCSALHASTQTDGCAWQHNASFLEHSLAEATCGVSCSLTCHPLHGLLREGLSQPGAGMP